MAEHACSLLQLEFSLPSICVACPPQLLLKSEASGPLTLLIFLLNALTLFLAGTCRQRAQGRCCLRGVLAPWVGRPPRARTQPCRGRPPNPLPPAGLWASVQFRFVQLQYPGVVIAFEKMLMAGCLPVAAAVITWGVAAGTGMSNACFFLAALLCGLYYLFGLPLPSSFHLGGRGRIAMGELAGQRGFMAFSVLAACRVGQTSCYCPQTNASGTAYCGACVWCMAGAMRPVLACAAGVGPSPGQARWVNHCLSPHVPPPPAPGPPRAVGGSKPKTHTLQDAGDGFAAFVLVTGLPVAVYLATHWAVIFS